MPEETYISSTAMEPLLVITPEGYTKHYYAGTERIAAQVGKGKFNNVNSSICDPRDTQDKLTEVNGFATYLVSYASPKFTYLNTLPILSTTAKEIYYYHTDHLGSSAWITDSTGVAVQHLAYLPWGEPYVTQKTGNFNPTYTFSGKERDEETGYSYFGQRFYDSEHSFWLSVDPMRGKYPSLSPFVYCANNPIRLVDPNGMEIDEWEINKKGKIVNHIKTDKHDAFYMVDNKGNRIAGKEISFDYGTIEKQKTIPFSSGTYDTYEVRGDKNGEALFEFFAEIVSNQKIEVSHAKTGIEGELGLNFITTAHLPSVLHYVNGVLHETASEPGMSYLLDGKLLHGYTIRELNHSHPISPKTSFADNKFANQIKDIQKKKGYRIPKFYIYYVPNKKYIPYGL